jgi:hypothetical protein
VASNDVFSALAEHWAQTVAYLEPEDRQLIQEAARLTAAVAQGAGDTREARAAVLRLTMRLADRLPAAHPVSAVISGGTRLAPAASELLAVAETLDVIASLAAVSPASPSGSPEYDPDDPDDPMGQLLAAPALTGEQVREGGTHPGLPGLIRLVSTDGVPRIPAFQFSRSGHPIQVVLTINRLLDVEDDPFGVADWWLGRNAWLDAVPADLIGHVDDELLVRAARAELSGE